MAAYAGEKNGLIERRQLSNEQYIVGWICAPTRAYVAAQLLLDERHASPTYVGDHDDNDYTLGRMGKHNVVMAVVPGREHGIVAAAAVARDMLHSFPNIRIGLMVGTGGGAPSAKHDIRLGDVAVSQPRDGLGGVLQHDMGKTIQSQPFKTTSCLAPPPVLLRTAVSGLEAEYAIHGHTIRQAVEDCLARNEGLRREFGRPDAATDRLYRSSVVHPVGEHSCLKSCGNDEPSLIQRRPRAEGLDDPAIHYGVIASGSQLMQNALIRDQYAITHGAICFETEAAGLMNHFPCLVVRGICNYADTHANKEWQGYAAMTAAAYAKDLLGRISQTQTEAERDRKWLADNGVL